MKRCPDCRRDHYDAMYTLLTTWQVFYADVGDKDRALAALNEAVDKSDQFIGFVKIEPFMKPLHDDPRFQQLLKRVGFPN
jgi:hypothetical protein